MRSVNNNGYGKIKKSGKAIYAHRWYYEQRFGPIPDGMELDHLCAPSGGPRSCVNPEHLEPVSGTENKRRGNGAKWTQREIERMRAEYAAGSISQKEIRLKYGVSPGYISLLLRGLCRVE